MRNRRSLATSSQRRRFVASSGWHVHEPPAKGVASRLNSTPIARSFGRAALSPSILQF